MDLVALARNPVPSGAVVGAFKGHDGLALRFARWSATRGPMRGTVCVFTGRAEFIEKYFEVIADLRRRGYAVATMDWRGQGGSGRMLPDPRKGHVETFADYERDLVRFMKDVVLPDCPPPYVALAHSMGGHVLLRNAAVQGSWFTRMVLTAPMISLHRDRLGMPEELVRALVEAAALAGLSRSYLPGGPTDPVLEKPFEGNMLTSDRERWERNRQLLEAAPHLGIGGPTFGWLRAALRSADVLKAPGFPLQVHVPMIIFIPGKDRIVQSRITEEIALNLKVGTQVLLPSAEHEVLQEVDEVRQRFWAAFDAYLGVDVGRM